MRNNNILYLLRTVVMRSVSVRVIIIIVDSSLALPKHTYLRAADRYMNGYVYSYLTSSTIDIDNE